MIKQLSLRNRFLVTISAAIMASLLTLLVVLSTILTPQGAHRLVGLEEQVRLHELASTMEGLSLSEIETRLNEYTVLKDGPPSDEVAFVEIESGYLVSTRPLNIREAGKVIDAPPWRQVLSLVTFVVLIYILATVLARFVSEPLTEVVAAVRGLAEGERGLEVPVPTETELAELAQNFNLMSRNLAQREMELKQALEAKDMIFATTSHELRTPLTAILGYCQLLCDGLKGELTTPQQQAVEVIERNAQGLLIQVEALLTLSQLRQGTLPFQQDVADLRDLAHEVTESLQPLAEEKALKLSLKLPDQSVPAKLDYGRGLQILRNLVANAIKYTETGEVSVRLADEGKNAQFTITDTGRGIPQEFQQDLFTEFARGPDTEGIAGSGLGLALSRRLAQSMEGDIQLGKSGTEGSQFSWTHPKHDTA